MLKARMQELAYYGYLVVLVYSNTCSSVSDISLGKLGIAKYLSF